MSNITEKVVEKIAGSNTRVFDSIVDALAAREIDKRVSTVVQAVDALQLAKREQAKASKPNEIKFTGTGEKIESFTKDAFEAKTKAEDKVKKIEGAIERALTDAQYDKLYELASSGAFNAPDKGGAKSKQSEPASF